MLWQAANIYLTSPQIKELKMYRAMKLGQKEALEKDLNQEKINAAQRMTQMGETISVNFVTRRILAIPLSIHIRSRNMQKVLMAKTECHLPVVEVEEDPEKM
jgi:hypothetical protein